MSESIVLNASDSMYGILSCNSKSKSLGGKTMVDYILDSLKLEITKSPIKDYMESKKQLLLYEAKKGVIIPDSWFRIGGDVHQRLINSKIESNIAKLYEKTYPELQSSFDKLNVTEISLIRKELYDHYVSQDLDDLEFGNVIEDFVMNGILRKDGQTIGSYYEASMNKVKTELTEKIINKMNEGIQLRLSEPKYLQALSYNENVMNELPFVVPESDDVDVLEQLNIFLLSEFRMLLGGRDVYRISNGNIEETTKIIIAVMRLIAGTRNYIRDDKIKITDKFSRDVLKLAFPNCEDLIVITTTIPKFAIELIGDTPGFQDVDPKLIWYYVERYVVITGMSTAYTRRDIGMMFEKITEIGEKLATDNKRESGKDILRNRMQRKANSTAFSPKMTDKITIYEMEGCPWCVRAQELLDKKNLKYEVISYTTVPREKLMKIVNSKDGSMSFPIVVINGKHIGGFTELDKLLK
jgi:glutaredoxin 3